MRQVRLVFLSIASSALLAGSVHAQSPQNIRITASRANVRLRPVATSTVMVTLPAGTIIEVTKKTGDWYEVYLPSDTTGFRRIGYVSVSVAEPLSTAVSPQPTARPPQIQGVPEQMTVSMPHSRKMISARLRRGLPRVSATSSANRATDRPGSRIFPAAIVETVGQPGTSLRHPTDGRIASFI